MWGYFCPTKSAFLEPPGDAMLHPSAHTGVEIGLVEDSEGLVLKSMVTGFGP